MMNTHWACPIEHRGRGIRPGNHNTEWGCTVADKHDPNGGPRECYACKIVYKPPQRRRQYAPTFHYACELMPWEHVPAGRPGALGGHREGCAVREGHTGGAGQKCYGCRMMYLGRKDNEVFLGPMNDHPHYDCKLTPAEHEPIKRSGRGHRPGCAVAEGHTFGKAKVCSACALARDDAGKVRASTIRRRFGVTTEQYDEMLARQNGGCAICGKTNPNGHRLAIDHNHRSGKVRGLLCRNCNSAIGQLLDSPELIRKAADYVESQAD